MRFVLAGTCPEAELAKAMVALESGVDGHHPLSMSYGGVVFELEITLKGSTVWLTPWSLHIRQYIEGVIKEYEKARGAASDESVDLLDVTYHEELWGRQTKILPDLVDFGPECYLYTTETNFKWQFRSLSSYTNPSLVQSMIHENAYSLVQDLADHLVSPAEDKLLWIPSESELCVPEAKILDLIIIVEEEDGRFRLYPRTKASAGNTKMVLWDWLDWQMAESLPSLDAYCLVKYEDIAPPIIAYYRAQLEKEGTKKCDSCGESLNGLSGALIRGESIRPLCYVCAGCETGAGLGIGHESAIVTWYAPVIAPPQYLAKMAYSDAIWKADGDSRTDILGVNNINQQPYVDRTMILNNPVLRNLGKGVLLCPERVAVFKREVPQPAQD